MEEAEGAAEAESQAVKLVEQVVASGELRGFGNGRGVRRPPALRASPCLARPWHAALPRVSLSVAGRWLYGPAPGAQADLYTGGPAVEQHRARRPAVAHRHHAGGRAHQGNGGGGGGADSSHRGYAPECHGGAAQCGGGASGQNRRSGKSPPPPTQSPVGHSAETSRSARTPALGSPLTTAAPDAPWMRAGGQCRRR